jgi:pyruvate,water dikinase
VRGIDEVLQCIREVFASLFNDQALAYRVHQNFEHMQVALSAGIQCMVHSDLASSGVLFTLDTESGFRDVVFVTAAWGLGELVVQGQVNPDEYYVWKEDLAQGKPAVLRRELGSKALRMVYATSSEERVAIEEVHEVDQQRFSLNDADVEELARYGVIIEQHYGRPGDIEWGKDGEDGKLYIL